MEAYSVQVEVQGPARSPGAQTSVVFTPAECVCTWSWGLQPATALIDWVSAREQPAILPESCLTISIGPKVGGEMEVKHRFYGICNSVVPVLGSDGHSMMQEFVDMRHFLMADMVFGIFNVHVHRIVNGRFLRRYEHVLPWHYNALRKTYTDTPYTARQICDFLFDAPTVQQGWERVYAPYMEFTPLFDLVFEGRKLGQALVEISEKLGLVFTLMGGRTRLVWTMKGVGDLPAFPPNSDRRRGPGQALSGNPTRVRILGDRNLYQVLNVELAPDWRPAWQGFVDFTQFVRDIFLHERTELPFGTIAAGTPYRVVDAGNEHNAGYLLARARAQTMTVGEYAALRDARPFDSGEPFRDYRKFGNRSRLNMPVALYVSQVVFRCFRFPPDFFIWGSNGEQLGLTSLEIADRSLAQVTHDPESGVMYWNPILPSAPNGYAIVQGYQVAQDAFKTLRPEYFNVGDWVATQAVWQTASFQIDNSGEGDQFIQFDDPIIRSGDLIALDGTGQYPGLNALATVQVPRVRVALTFAGERFSYYAGEAWNGQLGIRDDVVNEGRLNSEYVVANGTVTELAYADGQTGRQKAAALAAPLLNRQYYYQYGGYTVRGCNGTQLTSVIDRVTVRWNAQAGVEEDVDFTNERARSVVLVPTWTPRGLANAAVLQMEPERQYDRRAQLAPLMAGQAELRDQANQLRAEAAFFLKHPRVARNLLQTFHLLMGLDAPPEEVMLRDEAQGERLFGTALPLGTPLWREMDGTNPRLPNNERPVELEKPVFCGVTTVNGERADGPVRVTRMGNQGVVLARVKGPVQLHDGLGIQDHPRTHLEVVKENAVATALEEIAGATVRLIQCRVTGGGGGGGEVYFPWKVYASPAGDTDADTKDGWRKFRVRSGQVLLTDVEGIDITGIDGINPDADSTTPPEGTTPAEIVAPEKAGEFWIWLELTKGAAWTGAIRWGRDPKVAAEPGNPTPWTRFGELDGRHIPIAIVNTEDVVNERAVVRQLLRADLVLGVPVTVCDENGRATDYVLPGVMEGEVEG
jgi:hypothetical protein